MRRYPLVRHPSRFVWDFWYWVDRHAGMYHVFYLNAPWESKENDQHHFFARVGYAQTADFINVKWIDDDVFGARVDGWDNTSIWTGDIVRRDRELMMFYTSRDRSVDDGLTQYIGLARGSTHHVGRWDRDESVLLKADENFYETSSVKGDSSVHAWRDPFVFNDDGQLKMLVAAKSSNLPIGRKGCVGVLEPTDDTLMQWEARPPMWAPGCYSECEVPRMYRNAHGELVLTYTMWAKDDFCPTTHGAGGYHAVIPAEGKPWVLMPESEGVYACHIIPELEGDIVGFDIKQGGWRRIGAKTGLQRVHA